MGIRGDLAADLAEMMVNRGGIADRHDQRRRLALQRADRTKHIGRGEAEIFWRHRPAAGSNSWCSRSVTGSQRLAGIVICRAIKTLHKFKPPATEEEVRASSLQFVRKLSGFTHPSKANQLAFERVVGQITKAARELLDSLVMDATTPPSRSRGREGSGEGGGPVPGAAGDVARCLKLKPISRGTESSNPSPSGASANHRFLCGGRKWWDGNIASLGIRRFAREWRRMRSNFVAEGLAETKDHFQ